MDISIFKKSSSKTEQIDIQTAFNIWNLLVIRYSSLETNQMLKNFAHDRDLVLAMKLLIEHFQTQLDMLEKEAEKFELKTLLMPPFDVHTSARVDEITDKFIYHRINSDMISEMYSLSRAVKTTLTSDRLRKMFGKFLLSHLRDYEKLYKYGKIKGWVEIAPAFKTTKQTEVEPLSLSDAYHIWNLNQTRYGQYNLTEFYQGFAHDVEFKAAMTLAVKTLKNQINMLQQLSLKYEIPLPERPPASMKSSIDPETLEDRFMYQQILKGIDDSIEVHIRAVIETLRNDSIREAFMNLFKAELDIHDSMIKYGKAKGWAVIPPAYGEGTVG